ncbi:MAG TPA: AI-2E family transporter [Candidatus Aquilonibacter sp.]
MQNAISPLGWRRVLFALFGLAILIALYIFASHIPRTISIFLIAAFIAFGVQPVVRALTRRKVPKWLAITIVFAVLTIIIVVGLLVIVPLTIEQLQTLATNAPSYIAALEDSAHRFQDWLQTRVPGLQVPDEAFDIGQLGGQSLSTLVTNSLTSLGTILIGAATAFFVAFSSIVLSFFFLLNDERIINAFTSLFPAGRRLVARKLALEITETFGSFISGQVLVSAITGIVVTIVTGIIGFKFSLILGIVTAVAYAVPVIGMLIAQAIAVVLCAPQGGWMILWVQVIMFVMARISDNVLVPKIMGESVGVSPIGVMFAVFAGGELFGIPGLLLGIPAAALVKILWRYFVTPWLNARLDRA